MGYFELGMRYLEMYFMLDGWVGVYTYDDRKASKFRRNIEYVAYMILRGGFPLKWYCTAGWCVRDRFRVPLNFCF